MSAKECLIMVLDKRDIRNVNSSVMIEIPIVIMCPKFELIGDPQREMKC